MFKVNAVPAVLALLLINADSTEAALAGDFDPAAEFAWDNAIAECDLAQKQRVARQPVEAQGHVDLFQQYRDQAFKLAPAMKQDTEIAEEVRRCDRLAAIVEQSNERYEQQRASIEVVLEEGDAYVRQCEQSLDALQGNSIDEARFRIAEQAIDRAKSHKENLNAEWMAFKAFRDNPGDPAQVATAANLERGNACMVQAGLLISQKIQEVSAIDNELSQHLAAAQASHEACEQAENSTTLAATEANLSHTKALFSKAQARHGEAQGQLRADNIIERYSNWSQVGRIQNHLASASSCLTVVDAALGRMAAAVQERDRQLANAAQLARERKAAARLAQERLRPAVAPDQEKVEQAVEPVIDEPAAVATEQVQEKRITRVELEPAVRVQQEKRQDPGQEADRQVPQRTGLASVAARIERARLEAEAARRRDAEGQQSDTEETQERQGHLAGMEAERLAESRDNAGGRLPERTGLAGLAARLERARLQAEEAARSTEDTASAEKPANRVWQPQ